MYWKKRMFSNFSFNSPFVKVTFVCTPEVEHGTEIPWRFGSDHGWFVGSQPFIFQGVWGFGKWDGPRFFFLGGEKSIREILKYYSIWLGNKMIFEELIWAIFWFLPKMREQFRFRNYSNFAQNYGNLMDSMLKKIVHLIGKVGDIFRQKKPRGKFPSIQNSSRIGDSFILIWLAYQHVSPVSSMDWHPTLQELIKHHINSDQNPGCLLYIGNYPTQSWRDYNIKSHYEDPD